MVIVTVVMILWIVMGIVFGIFNTAFVILSGLILWSILSGVLIHYWGKDYMSCE